MKKYDLYSEISFIELQKKIYIEACLHQIKEEEEYSGIPFKRFDHKGEPFILDDSIDKQRKIRLSHYNTVDPLFWDMLLQNEVSVMNEFDNSQWRKIINGQIKWVVNHYKPNEEEYIRIGQLSLERGNDTTINNNLLYCLHCKNNDISELNVSQDYPFHTYCNNQCRLLHIKSNKLML